MLQMRLIEGDKDLEYLREVMIGIIQEIYF